VDGVSHTQAAEKINLRIDPQADGVDLLIIGKLVGGLVQGAAPGIAIVSTAVQTVGSVPAWIASVDFH
jgi:hypothetical protein